MHENAFRILSTLADPEGGGRDICPPKIKGGERKKGKESKERERGGVQSVSKLFIVTCKNVFSYIKHSTDKSGFPFITSETIIIIELLDHIDPSVQFV